MGFISPAGQSDKLSYRPLARIPERRSSRLFRTQSDSSQDNLSQSSAPTRPPTRGPHAFRRQQPVTARGKSASPIKERSTIDDGARIFGSGARTFVPTSLPNDILLIPKLTHPRLQFDVHLLAPLFVGGATIEGEIHIKIDANYNETKRQSLPTLTVHRISATVVGVEHCKSRREIFNALMTHVVHVNELPVIGDQIKAFSIDLPIRTGPPSYKSRKAGITYLLSVLVELRISDETHFVRQTKEIDILSVFDPEKALVNLSRPLVVKDELRVSPDSSVSLTAALHRQIWIGGYLLFVDLNVDNWTTKAIKRIDVQLERMTMYYNATAPIRRGSPNTSDFRIPDEMHKSTLLKRSILPGTEPILPNTASFRTAHLRLPPDIVSVTTARYFGVTYTLSVKLAYSYSKVVKISLPITLIHPNSIDVPPNALAQVTASIENAKSRSRASRNTTPVHGLYRPGSAFVAARRASLLQLRDQAWWAGRRVVGGTTHPPRHPSDMEPPRGRRSSTYQDVHHDERQVASSELDDLARALERSPRRYAPIRINEAIARPSIDTLAARPEVRARPSLAISRVIEMDQPNLMGALSSKPLKMEGDGSRKIKIKRRRSIAAALGSGSGDLNLSHFDGTGDGNENKHLRRGSKSLELDSRKASGFVEGRFDGSVSERVWGEGRDELESGPVDLAGTDAPANDKMKAKDKRKGLRYRFPGSTEMAGLGSEESISTLRPETPSPPPPPLHRRLKHNRSVSFGDEVEGSVSESLGTVNKTPKRMVRAGLEMRACAETDEGSEKENREPALGTRQGGGVRGRWRHRFLFG